MAITPKPRGNVVEYFRGNGNKNFEREDGGKWISLMITNDSSTDNLIFKINDMSIIVRAGEIMDEDFRDFDSLSIQASDYFRIWLRE